MALLCYHCTVLATDEHACSSVHRELENALMSAAAKGVCMLHNLTQIPSPPPLSLSHVGQEIQKLMVLLRCTQTLIHRTRFRCMLNGPHHQTSHCLVPRFLNEAVRDLYSPVFYVNMLSITIHSRVAEAVKRKRRKLCTVMWQQWCAFVGGVWCSSMKSNLLSD